ALSGPVRRPCVETSLGCVEQLARDDRIVRSLDAVPLAHVGGIAEDQTHGSFTPNIRALRRPDAVCVERPCNPPWRVTRFRILEHPPDDWRHLRNRGEDATRRRVAVGGSSVNVPTELLLFRLP